MRLATLRLQQRTAAVRIDGSHAVDLGYSTVESVLARADWRHYAATADGPHLPLPTPASLDVSYAPVVTTPGKIICVGLNYAPHILEMGRELPQHPTLFAKFADALLGAYDSVALPQHGHSAADWEAELAIVVGARLRSASPHEAAQAIGGYTVLNDITMRDWQYRTSQWLQGKTFEASTPIGPYLATSDEFGAAPEFVLTCLLDDEVVQHASTRDLVFTPPQLLAYISQITTLNPGDVLATGTPGGVGHARDPKRYLTPGTTLITRVDGLGEQRNAITDAHDTSVDNG